MVSGRRGSGSCRGCGSGGCAEFGLGSKSGLELDAGSEGAEGVSMDVNAFEAQRGAYVGRVARS